MSVWVGVVCDVSQYQIDGSCQCFREARRDFWRCRCNETESKSIVKAVGYMQRQQMSMV